MHNLKGILVQWRTFGRKNKKYQCIPLFSLKTICRYLFNNRINSNFITFSQWILLQFVLKFMFVFRNGPPVPYGKVMDS